MKIVPLINATYINFLESCLDPTPKNRACVLTLDPLILWYRFEFNILEQEIL